MIKKISNYEALKICNTCLPINALEFWIRNLQCSSLLRRMTQADLLLDFLKYNVSEKMYLVDDIVDGWRLKRSWY